MAKDEAKPDLKKRRVKLFYSLGHYFAKQFLLLRKRTSNLSSPINQATTKLPKGEKVIVGIKKSEGPKEIKTPDPESMLIFGAILGWNKGSSKPKND